MSHYRLKTKYKVVEAPYGNVEERTLFVHVNNSCDITTFYDQDGTYLFSFQDTEDNNLFDAMTKLAGGVHQKNSSDLIDGVEHMTLEEMKICGL